MRIKWMASLAGDDDGGLRCDDDDDDNDEAGTQTGSQNEVELKQRRKHREKRRNQDRISLTHSRLCVHSFIYSHIRSRPPIQVLPTPALFIDRFDARRLRIGPWGLNA